MDKPTNQPHPNDPPPPYSATVQQPGPTAYGQTPAGQGYGPAREVPPTGFKPGPVPPPGNATAPPGYAQAGYMPPHSGYYPPPPPGFVPNYGATTTVIVPPPIITVGACPACRVGMLEDDFTCLGILCAIIFFPLGILCCLALKNRRCSNCGAYFG